MTDLFGLSPQKPPPPPPVEHFCDHPDCAHQIDADTGRRLWGSFGFTILGVGTRWFCAEHRESGPLVLQERGR